MFIFVQAPEEGGEEKLALEEDENTKINMDHYYPDEYDKYAEGMYFRDKEYHLQIYKKQILNPIFS